MVSFYPTRNMIILEYATEEVGTNRTGGHGGGGARLRHPGGEPLGHRPAHGVGFSGRLHTIGSSWVRKRSSANPNHAHAQSRGAESGRPRGYRLRETIAHSPRSGAVLGSRVRHDLENLKV